MWWYILTYPAQIIGYLRIALICVAFCYVNTNPTYFVIYYSISYTLDEVDGRVAKLLGQTTNFGAVFDQCIDRSGTAALCLALILVDNDNFLIYLSFIFLDIVSHFIFMNAALLLKLDSHKTVKNWFLKIYYHRQFNMLVCAQEFVGYLLIYMFIKTEFLFPI